MSRSETKRAAEGGEAVAVWSCTPHTQEAAMPAPDDWSGKDEEKV